MTVLVKWQCMSCKHYSTANRCVAFPSGIPKEIYYGEHDHSKPFKGDNGILFEKDSETKTKRK